MTRAGLVLDPSKLLIEPDPGRDELEKLVMDASVVPVTVGVRELAEWVAADLMETVWDEETHPRWPPGAKDPDGKPIGGQFMRVGERFMKDGHEWEVSHVADGRVIAIEASGKIAQAETRVFEPKVVSFKTIATPDMPESSWEMSGAKLGDLPVGTNVKFIDGGTEYTIESSPTPGIAKLSYVKPNGQVVVLESPSGGTAMFVWKPADPAQLKPKAKAKAVKHPTIPGVVMAARKAILGAYKQSAGGESTPKQDADTHPETHDPGLALPDGSKLTPDEWKLFGRADQLLYRELMHRFGPYDPSGSFAGSNGQLSRFNAALAKYSLAAQSAVTAGMGNQYGESGGNYVTLASGFDSDMSPAALKTATKKYQESRELQGEVRELVAYELYNRLHAPSVMLTHWGHSPAWFYKQRTAGTHPVMSALSSTWAPAQLTSFGPNAFMYSVPVRSLAMATDIIGSNNNGMASERELTHADEMRLKPSLGTYVQGLSNASSGGKGALRSYVYKLTASHPATGDTVTAIVDHLSGKGTLPLPPEPLELQWTHVAAAAKPAAPEWKEPPSSAWLDLKGKLAAAPGYVGGKSAEQSLSTAGQLNLKPGDVIETQTVGKRYLVVEDPQAGFQGGWSKGIRYLKLTADGDYTGSSFTFDGPDQKFRKLAVYVPLAVPQPEPKKKPKVKEGPPEFDPDAWVADLDVKKPLGEFQAGEKVWAAGNQFEVQPGNGTYGVAKLKQLGTGKPADANAAAVVSPLVPKKGYVPKGALVAKKDDVVLLHDEDGVPVGIGTVEKVATKKTKVPGAPAKMVGEKYQAGELQPGDKFESVFGSMYTLATPEAVANANYSLDHGKVAVVTKAGTLSSATADSKVKFVGGPSAEQVDQVATAKTFKVKLASGEVVDAKVGMLSVAPAYGPAGDAKKGDVFAFEGKKMTVTNVLKDGTVKAKMPGGTVQSFKATHPALEGLYRPVDHEIGAKAKLHSLPPGALVSGSAVKQHPYVVLGTSGKSTHLVNLETGEGAQVSANKSMSVLHMAGLQDGQPVEPSVEGVDEFVLNVEGKKLKELPVEVGDKFQAATGSTWTVSSVEPTGAAPKILIKDEFGTTTTVGGWWEPTMMSKKVAAAAASGKTLFPGAKMPGGVLTPGSVVSVKLVQPGDIVMSPTGAVHWKVTGHDSGNALNVVHVKPNGEVVGTPSWFTADANVKFISGPSAATAGWLGNPGEKSIKDLALVPGDMVSNGTNAYEVTAGDPFTGGYELTLAKPGVFAEPKTFPSQDKLVPKSFMKQQPSSSSSVGAGPMVPDVLPDAADQGVFKPYHSNAGPGGKYKHDKLKDMPEGAVFVGTDGKPFVIKQAGATPIVSDGTKLWKVPGLLRGKLAEHSAKVIVFHDATGPVDGSDAGMLPNWEGKSLKELGVAPGDKFTSGKDVYQATMVVAGGVTEAVVLSGSNPGKTLKPLTPWSFVPDQFQAAGASEPATAATGKFTPASTLGKGDIFKFNGITYEATKVDPGVLVKGDVFKHHGTVYLATEDAQNGALEHSQVLKPAPGSGKSIGADGGMWGDAQVESLTPTAPGTPVGPVEIGSMMKAKDMPVGTIYKSPKTGATIQKIANTAPGKVKLKMIDPGNLDQTPDSTKPGGTWVADGYPQEQEVVGFEKIEKTNPFAELGKAMMSAAVAGPASPEAKKLDDAFAKATGAPVVTAPAMADLPLKPYTSKYGSGGKSIYPTIGELSPGQKFRDKTGAEFVLTSLLEDGGTTVSKGGAVYAVPPSFVNPKTGKVQPVRVRVVVS